jgi:hypothetical protein
MKILDTQIEYISGGKHQLIKDVSFQVDIYPPENIITRFVELTTTGLLTLKEGFFWDGASGPTVDSMSSRRGAAIHDGLYRLAQKGYLKGEANRRKIDYIFYRYIRYDGMCKARAKVWLRSVRRWASKSYIKRKKVHIAPKGSKI